MGEPRRAQNYIPISSRSQRPSDPARYKTEGNLAVEIERRVQKQPANRESNARAIAPKVKSNLYNNRIEATPGRKMPLKTAVMQRTAAAPQRGTAAMQRTAAAQQRGTEALQQRGTVATQQRKAPMQQRSAVMRQSMTQANAAAREQARQSRPEQQQRQNKNMAQNYRSIMQGGHVSMRGEMAIPLPHPGIKIKKDRAKAPSAGVQIAARPAGIVSTILLIVFVFGVLSFLLMRSATISGIGLENAKIQNNITTLSQSLDKTKLDVTMKDDLSTIQQRAQQLNMGVPASGQITYLPKEDKAEASTPAASDTQTADSSKDTTVNLNSLFKEIKSWFG